MDTLRYWLQADDIELDVRSPDKRVALAALARRLAAQCGGEPQTVFHALWEREGLGSTGLGHGVALPHARLAGLLLPVTVFHRLQPAIAFDAPDGKPVGLVLALLLPLRESQRHLKLFAHIAGLLSEAQFREELAQAEDPHAVARLFARG